MTLVASCAFFGCVSLFDHESLFHELLYIVHLVLLLYLLLHLSVVPALCLFFCSVQLDLNWLLTLLAVACEYDSSILFVCFLLGAESLGSFHMLGIQALYHFLTRPLSLFVPLCNCECSLDVLDLPLRLPEGFQVASLLEELASLCESLLVEDEV